MSKSSFSEIEQAIKAAVEAHEPAFDGQSWEKMEALLDREKERRRPVVFWLWLFVPVLIGFAGYFIFINTDKNKLPPPVIVKVDNQLRGNLASSKVPLTDTKTGKSLNNNESNLNGFLQKKQTESNASEKNNKPGNFAKDKSTSLLMSKQTNNQDQVFSKNNIKGFAKSKTSAAIKPATIEEDNNIPFDLRNDKLTSGFNNKQIVASEKIRSKSNLPVISKTKTIPTIKPATAEEGNESREIVSNPERAKSDLTNKEKKEIVVVKVDAAKKSDKEIETIIDSIAAKLTIDKKLKNKISRFYIVAAGGAEGNGVKLFSTDKITMRAGLGLGYQVNKNISVQTGFYLSSKKYKANGRDYKTKPGSYWNIVDIKTIDANCRVYEIPISISYNFTPGKKINIFASTSLSSYIMKKEDYQIFYEHYGIPQQAAVKYAGNKNLFSVFRFSAGIEKKIAKNFSIIASPGVAIPLAGVGEGEVKLYTTDIMFGIKFFLPQKK